MRCALHCERSSRAVSDLPAAASVVIQRPPEYLLQHGRQRNWSPGFRGFAPSDDATSRRCSGGGGGGWLAAPRGCRGKSTGSRDPDAGAIDARTTGGAGGQGEAAAADGTSPPSRGRVVASDGAPAWITPAAWRATRANSPGTRGRAAVRTSGRRSYSGEVPALRRKPRSHPRASQRAQIPLRRPDWGNDISGAGDR